MKKTASVVYSISYSIIQDESLAFIFDVVLFIRDSTVGEDGRARERRCACLLRARPCQLFFSIKNVITHKQKTKLNFDCTIKSVLINTLKLDLT
jgi:hypothetical protein